MRRPEELRPYAAGVHDRGCPELEIAPHVARRLEMQLPMVVAVVADGVALFGDPAYDRRPSLGVSPEDEERGFNAALFQSVEDRRSRQRIRTIVKGEGEPVARGRHAGDHSAKKGTVGVERAVNHRAGDRSAKRGLDDHATSSATCPRTER